MIQPHVEELVTQRNRRFRWEAFLPKRKAWIQTLILLPFGLAVGNFLANSWYFSINAIVEERQYLLGLLSMVFNLLLPSIFFAFVFHWGWFVWRQPAAWYPHRQSLWAGCYATLTIAASFGMVGLFTHSLGVCTQPGWGEIGQTLLCNLDGYGYESKSWFGAWFIIAAYCYQAKESIESACQRLLQPRHYPDRFPFNENSAPVQADFGAVATAHGDLAPHDDFSSQAIDSIDPDHRD